MWNMNNHHAGSDWAFLYDSNGLLYSSYNALTVDINILLEYLTLSILHIPCQLCTTNGATFKLVFISLSRCLHKRTKYSKKV